MIVERRVDEHQGVLPAVRPVQTPWTEVELPRNRKHERRFERLGVGRGPEPSQIPEAIAVAAAIESIAVIHRQTQVRMRSFDVVPCCIVTVALPRLEMVRRRELPESITVHGAASLRPAAISCQFPAESVLSGKPRPRKLNGASGRCEGEAGIIRKVHLIRGVGTP